MSFSSHRKAVLDEAMPLAHRASHARSCALRVADKLGVERAVVLRHVAARTGVDLDHPADAPRLLQAFAAIEALRAGESSIAGDAQ